MKCIATLPGITEREMKILRVRDAEARARVASGEAMFVSKAEWKKLRPHKPKPEEDAK